MADDVKLPTVNIDTISAILNLKPENYFKLARRGIVPKSKRGQYDVFQCCKSYVQHLQTRLDSEQEKDLQSERTRLLAAQADIAEKEVQFLELSLIPVGQVEKLIQAMNMAARAKLLTLPSKTAAVLLAADNMSEVQKILKQEIYEALQELHDEIPSSLGGAMPKFNKSLAASA